MAVKFQIGGRVRFVRISTGEVVGEPTGFILSFEGPPPIGEDVTFHEHEWDAKEDIRGYLIVGWRRVEDEPEE